MDRMGCCFGQMIPGDFSDKVTYEQKTYSGRQNKTVRKILAGK